MRKLECATHAMTWRENRDVLVHRIELESTMTQPRRQPREIRTTIRNRFTHTIPLELTKCTFGNVE
ncbi:hypothetical protein BLOT_013093 [Blomia tropicalis]|nr:hypothetical protein BLOT_013093 [Blomia tropicalis]